MINGSNLEDIKAGLQSSISRDEVLARPKSGPKLAYAFTCQGLQYPRIGRRFLESFSAFRNDILHFDLIGRSQSFTSILSVIGRKGRNCQPFIRCRAAYSHLHADGIDTTMGSMG